MVEGRDETEENPGLTCIPVALRGPPWLSSQRSLRALLSTWGQDTHNNNESRGSDYLLIFRGPLLLLLDYLTT